MNLLYSFIFCIFISTAFCDEGAQLLMQKDTLPESLPSNDNSVNPLNDDGLKVDEAKAEDMPSISMKTVEDVMENDSANPVSDEANPSINSDYVSNEPADDNVKIDSDNVGDDNDDIIDDNEDISDDNDDISDDNEDISDNNDDISDDSDDTSDDNDEVSDDSDDVDDEDDDLDDEDYGVDGEYYGVDDEDDNVDDEDDDVDDEDDEELVYHYIVNDQEPNNDEQITELYSSDELPDEVIEKILANDL